MPKLQEAKKEVAEKIVHVDKQKKEVAENTKGIEAEKVFPKDMTGVADVIQKDYEFQLSKIMTILTTGSAAKNRFKIERSFETIPLLKSFEILIVSLLIMVPNL